MKDLIAEFEALNFDITSRATGMVADAERGFDLFDKNVTPEVIEAQKELLAALEKVRDMAADINLKFRK
ncbi:hypothetical protein [Marivivens aquimaris]|uniref:hypothetical protein n=1 Tax=Marivivens aquimaris TaxID=2774876 RepID=UPI0018824221|nr:hypothetical protein [Marivivens aquimaris]